MQKAILPFLFILFSCSQVNYSAKVVGDLPDVDSQKKVQLKEFKAQRDNNRQSLKIALLKLEFNDVRKGTILLDGDSLMAFSKTEEFKLKELHRIQKLFLPELSQLANLIERTSYRLIIHCSRPKWCDVLGESFSSKALHRTQFISKKSPLKKMSLSKIVLLVTGDGLGPSFLGKGMRYKWVRLDKPNGLFELSAQQTLELLQNSNKI